MIKYFLKRNSLVEILNPIKLFYSTNIEPKHLKKNQPNNIHLGSKINLNLLEVVKKPLTNPINLNQKKRILLMNLYNRKIVNKHRTL